MNSIEHYGPAQIANAATAENVYPRRGAENYAEAYAAYRARSGEIHVQFKATLAVEYLPGVPVAASDLVFARAWADGHSDGHSQVEWMYSDLADLVLAVHKALTAASA